jgi:hypothetical protein
MTQTEASGKGHMPATFNRLDPCGLYLSPNFALPSAINIAIRRFPSFEAGLEYLRTEVRPDSRKFYRKDAISRIVLTIFDIANGICDVTAM